jgi:hypothetical protein
VDLRRLPAWLTKTAMLVAGLFAGVTIGVHLATYGPDEIGETLMTLVLGLFVAIFPIFGSLIVALGLARIRLDRVFAGMPTYIYVVGVVVVLYVFWDFFTMALLLPGQPEQIGSNYYFDNKGSLIPITADVYRMGLMHAARLFSGHELLFFGMAALAAYQVDGIRSGRIKVGPTVPGDSMERAQLPYPLQRVVFLRTSHSPQECAERLMAQQPRQAWSFAAARGLQGEASADGFHIELASPQQIVYAVGHFETTNGTNSVRLLLTFKTWVLLSVGISAVLIPMFWAVMELRGFPLPWEGLAFVLVVGVGGNFLFGLDQRRRLLAEIRRALDAAPLGLSARGR